MEYGYSSGDYGDEFRFSGGSSSSYDTYAREGREFVSTSAVSMQPMALMQGQALQAMPVMASREFDREQFEQEPYRYVDEYNRAVYPEAPSQQYLSQGQQAFEDRPGYEDNEYRERERERDRSYRRSRDSRDRRRDGRRYDSRDRDRDRERDRDRGDSWRSRDRRDRDSPRNDDGNPDLGQNEESNDSRDSRDSRESRDKRDHRDRDRDRDRDREDRAGEKWMTETPTNTILIRGLSFDVDEKDIRAELMLFGCPIKDVRLMRRSSGASRGFAFVEFQNVTDAQRWMDQNQGKMQLLNQHSVSLHYSTPRVGPEKSQQTKMDWVCSKCNVHNFRRRDFCFKCNLSREESERTKDGDGFDQVGTNPCNTLIFRGLDALTTEETLCQAIGQHTSIAIKNVRVIRDQLTNTSRGYAFAELGSVAEGTQLLEFLTALNPPLEVDGKQILVSYARNTFNTVMTQIHNFYSQQGDYYGGYYGQGDYSQGFDAYYQGGQYYAEGQAYDYSQYYAAGTTTTTEKQNTTNAAAAVAQAAIQQAQAAKQYQKHTAPTSTASAAVESSTEYPKYPPPDVSTYQYDESSGYYYDPLTGLYYDANSQYYYNAQSQQYMYWDAEKSSYLPAPNQSQAEGSVSATSGQSNNQETGDTNKDGSKKDPNNKDKKEKVKVAKRIAKDMEKWAKAMNTKKEAMKDGMRFALAAQKAERESATADAGFAIVEKLKSGSLDDKKLMPPPPLAGGRNEASPSKPASASPALVASYGGDSDDEEDEEGVVDESKLVDWTKLACLLCKRQFQSNEILTKHMQFSDLHKQNLENFRSKQASGEKKEYRDRAKERREKYGKTEPPVPKKQHVEAPVVTELPPRPAMDSGNIGNKLLQKMGWSAGQGLGKANQGRTAPVETQRRVTNAGLGVKGANVAAAAGDTYKDAVKKTMFARYHDLE